MISSLVYFEGDFNEFQVKGEVKLELDLNKFCLIYVLLRFYFTILFR